MRNAVLCLLHGLASCDIKSGHGKKRMDDDRTEPLLDNENWQRALVVNSDE
jgi:hypothetical protein